VTPTEFRAVLRGLGLSQRAFASRLGLDAHTVNRWAQGSVPVPRYAIYVLELLSERRELAEKLGA